MSAAEMSPQRHAELSCFEVPAGVFNRRFSHPVTPHRPHQIEHLRRAVNASANDHRREEFMQRGPRGVSPLIAVERTFAGRTFTPALSAVGVGNSRQHDAPFSCTTEAGFEEVNEGKADLAQFNRLNDQGQKVAPP